MGINGQNQIVYLGTNTQLQTTSQDQNNTVTVAKKTTYPPGTQVIKIPSSVAGGNVTSYQVVYNPAQQQTVQSTRGTTRQVVSINQPHQQGVNHPQQQIVQIQNQNGPPQRLIIPQPSIGSIYTTNDGTIVFNQGDGSMRTTQGGQIQLGGGSKIYIQQQPQTQGIITHAGAPVIHQNGQLFRIHSAGQNGRLVNLGPNTTNRVMVSRPATGTQQVLINKPIQPIQQTKLVNQVQVQSSTMPVSQAASSQQQQQPDNMNQN